MHSGARWATVYGVAKNLTWLKLMHKTRYSWNTCTHAGSYGHAIFNFIFFKEPPYYSP